MPDTHSGRSQAILGLNAYANLYFLPLAWLIARTGAPSADIDVSIVTVAGIFHNLVAAPLGNIVGGAGLVGFVYRAIYRKGLAAREK